MPNRYEVEIETRFRELWSKSPLRAVDEFIALVIDATQELGPGFREQKYEAAGVFTLQHLFLFVPAGGDVGEAERQALDRLKAELL